MAENEKKNNAVSKEDEDLFKVRESIPLTKENAHFFRSEGGLISLEVTQPDGTVENFERIIPIRAFPITEPNEFIAIREPDKKDKGHGEEIGMIRHITDVDEEAQALINEELDRRYFTPAITRIYSMKDKFGYSYWDIETTSGKMTIMMSAVRSVEDGRVFVFDIEGNCFSIEDVEKLDKLSLRKIETYL